MVDDMIPPASTLPGRHASLCVPTMTSEDLYYNDATSMAELVRGGQASPVDLVQAHLERIEAVNPRLNAVVTLDHRAEDRAREAEAALARGESWGPLHGVPFTVKDCIDNAGLRTTRGSKLFADRVPESDAPVVRRLKEAGGIVIGKTNMPEFALWWETDNVVFSRTENPWLDGRTPGGSSGGEAAAIAAGLSPLGLGSDVGGSIREPANYCGVVGLKATHGRVPLTGHWPDVLLRFMHVGPLARTVRDVALALDVIAGPDGADPYAVPIPKADAAALEGSVAGLRVGRCVEGPFAPLADDVRDAVAAAASALDEAGCNVESVSLADWEQWSALEISSRVYGPETLHYLEPLVAGREGELSPPIRRRLAWPQPPMSEYLSATEELEGFRQAVARYFAGFDLLLCPVGPVPAHPHDSAEIEVAGKKLPGRSALRATIPFDLTGSPAISVPFRWSAEGLPIGVQLVGRHFGEPTLLRAAAALESAREDPQRRPSV